VLGAGLRVGARIAGQRMAASAQSATTAPTPQAVAGAGVVTAALLWVYDKTLRKESAAPAV